MSSDNFQKILSLIINELRFYYSRDDLHEANPKASGAALGLNCVASFEQPAGVFAGCVAIRQAKIFTFQQFIARANRRFTPHNCILLARWRQFDVI